MRRSLFVSALATMSLLVAAAQPALAGGEFTIQDITFTVTKVGAQYRINQSGGPVTDILKIDIPLANSNCDNIDFANSGTGGAITARNTQSPPGQPKKANVSANNNATTPQVQFCCTADHGEWRFEIGDGVGGSVDAVLIVNVRCHDAVPSTGTFGLLVLTGLMIGGAGIALYWRRRIA
jgi:hypothetical protein